jgi:hypothetical protein
MPDVTDVLGKQDLIAAIRKERAKLDERFTSLDGAAFVAPARDDGWSAKDVLAHITAWERRLLSWIERWRATGDPQRPEPGMGWDAIDALNGRDYAAAKDAPAVEVRRAAAASYEDVLRTIETLSDAELVERTETWDMLSLSWIVGANTHEHYAEHREEVEAWLRDHPS